MKRRRTYGRGVTGRTRKILIGVTAAALAGGAFAVSTGVSGASETGSGAACAGIDRSMRETLDFMADQRAHPTAQTPAVLVNRQAVVDLLTVQARQAGCANAGPAAIKPTRTATKPTRTAASSAPAATAPAAGAGEVVCKGSTVTLSGEAGTAAAASSGTFPVGTVLKVTNLDNNRSITVRVTEPSGSCVLLNNAAFEQVREPGKFLIRRAVIERVG
jgi:hypothetical protein